MDELLQRWSIRRNQLSGDSHLRHFSNLTDDIEKIRSALQYLSENEKPLHINKQIKSIRQATNLIELGNDSIQLISCKSLIELYTQAIIHAPHGSIILARAYGNRSAALFNSGLYVDCLSDIKRALNNGYPDGMKAKLYVQKAKCLIAMYKKMTQEVRTAIADARKWLEKMDDVHKRFVIDMLDNLNSDTSMAKPFIKTDNSQFIPSIIGKNRRIKGASSAIGMKYSEELGSHVVATRDIRAGEPLLVHRAYSSIVKLDQFHKFCWYCSKPVWAGVPCHQCITLIYCNEVCREKAWKEHHDIECPVIVAMIGAKMGMSELTCLRLIVKGYKESGSLKNLKENIIMIDTAKNPLSQSYHGKAFDHTKYASICVISRMKMDAPDEFVVALQSSVILFFLAAMTDIFRKKIDSFHEMLSDKSIIFFGGLIFRHASSLGINNEQLDEVDRVGVNPFLTFWNHSCDFMTFLHSSGDTNVVVALQSIRKGEQICTNYGVNFYYHTTEERRNYLMKMSNISCECIACKENWGPESSFISQQRAWPPNIEAQSSHISLKYPDTSMYTSADSADKRMIISNLANKINFLQSFGEYPTIELMNLKALLFNVYGSISD